MIIVSDWLLFDIVYVLKHSSQSESSITPDQSNPSKLETFKSYNKTITVTIYIAFDFIAYVLYI